MEVTNAELAVMEVLWEHSPSNRKDLVAKLYPDGTESARATIQKLLERLERKQLVERDASSRIHLFTAIVSRQEYLDSQLESLADSICGGSFGAIVSHLVKRERLTPKDLEELRNLIDRD